MSGSHSHAGARAHAHAHGSSTSGAVSRNAQRRALRVSLVANGGFLVAEVIGGLAFRSLALLADAAHMLTDVVGLVIALVAQSLLARPSTERHTYGLQRAEVLGGQFNAITLLLAAVWIVYEAIERIGSPTTVQGGGMLVVAALGLAVNVVSAVLLLRARGSSLNMQGAFVHMVVDAAGSVGAIAAAVAVIVWDANWADPAISIAIAVLVVWSAGGLLRDTTRVLLEGTPAGLVPGDVEAAFLSSPDVDGVHHLHLWSLASDVPALSAHVVFGGELTLHDAQQRGEQLKTMLEQRFGIGHATLELECHACDAPLAEHRHEHDLP